MPNNKVILVTILVLILLSGCKNRGNSIEGGLKEIRTGTDGLVMSFMKSMPPSNVYEENQFPVAVQLKNKGATNIEDGYLALSIENSYMEILNEGPVYPFYLDGKSIGNPIGSESIKNYQITAKKIEAQSISHTSTILLTGCYKYQTQASSEVCIDADIYKERQMKKACVPSAVSLSSQAAPVAVISIEPAITTLDEYLVRPEFTITIENKGNGLVIDQSIVEKACSSESFDRKAFNGIIVDAYMGDDQQLDCKPKKEEAGKEGYVRLSTGQATVRCTLLEGMPIEKPAYQGLITVILDYGYTQSIASEVIIKKHQI